MKNQKGFSILTIVFIVVFVAILAVAGYLAYKHYAPQKQQVQTQQSSSELNLNGLKVNTLNYDKSGVYINDAQNYQISYAAGTKLQETLDYNKYCVSLFYKGGYITIASLKDDKNALDSGQAITSCAVIDGLGSGYTPITQLAIVDGKKYNAQGFQYQNKANDPYYQYHNTALVFPLTDNITIQYGYNNSSDTTQATDQEYDDTMNVITQILFSFKFIK